MSLQTKYLVVLSLSCITFFIIKCFKFLLLDNSKKVELQEENDQDIYVPKFFIPPINIFSIGHAVKNAEIKSVNEAQVCVDDSFLPKSETPDSESKGMGSMEIERSIVSDKKTRS